MVRIDERVGAQIRQRTSRGIARQLHVSQKPAFQVNDSTNKMIES